MKQKAGYVVMRPIIQRRTNPKPPSAQYHRGGAWVGERDRAQVFSAFVAAQLAMQHRAYMVATI